MSEENISFLPTVYDILKSIEKDPQSLTVNINELKQQLEKAKELVDRLPGIDLSKDQQLQQIDIYRTQLTLKIQLIKKYKDLSRFDIL